jgi:predicted permease
VIPEVAAVPPEVLFRLLSLLVLLGVGIGARAAGVLGAERRDNLNAFAFYVALPALVFTATYDRNLGALVSPALVVGLWLVVATTALLAWLVHRYRESTARQSVAVVQSYHANIGFLGLPLVAATFDGTTTAVASVILGVVSLTQTPLTVFLLTRMNDAEASVRAELAQLVRNPVLGSLVAGILVSATGTTVPGAAVGGLGAVAELALPAALICVGATLPLDLPSVNLDATVTTTVLKVCCMPAVAWIVFSALGVPPRTFVAGVTMLAMPTAVSTFVYAGELGGDQQFASTNVFATTVASVGSLFVLLSIVG